VTRRLELDDLRVLRVPSSPAIAPDGGRVVYALRGVSTDDDRDDSSLWTVATGSPEPRALTTGPSDDSPAWSPTGREIAFLRQRQVWTMPMDGPGEPRRITDLPGGAGAPVWSPDGTAIAFRALVGEPSATAPIVIDRLGYKADGMGMTTGRCSHVFVVPAAGGECRQITSGDWSVTSVAWNAEGTRLAVTGRAGTDADITGRSAVYLLDLDAEDPEPRIASPDNAIATTAACWPRAGGPVYIGRTDTKTGLLSLLRVGTDAVRSLTATLDRNVMAGGTGYPGGLPQVTHDQRSVVFCARDRGCTHVYRVGLDGQDEPEHLLGGPDEVVCGLSVAAAAPLAACVVAGPDSYGEIVLLDLDSGERRTLTAHTSGTLPDVDLFVPVERTFTISDGTPVHGWLLRDPDASTPGPLLLDIHGGPHNAWSPVPDVGHGYQQLLVAQGWTVLTLNPRASDGYGEAFFNGNIGRWGHGDQADFLEPVETLVAEGIADPRRLAVTGYSYGGYMTCWLTSHTDRFAAAIAGGVVADTVSLVASDMGFPLLSDEMAAEPWGGEAAAGSLAAQSPYAAVGEVRTPTLILHGGADERCPLGQAEQWFAALRAQGVTTRMVVYPEASHLFILSGRPSHRRDYSQRLVDWCRTHAEGVSA
jgi:dipeptidyl aminopeptidase/acylaminoacyl peptidase